MGGGRHRIRAYVHQNHPVITANPGHADDKHPIHTVGILARRPLGAASHRTLRQLHGDRARWGAEAT